MFRTERRWMASRLGIVAGLVGAGLCLLVVASCNKPQAGVAPAVLPRGDKPVLHAVYAKELREAMHDLNLQANQQVWMKIYTSGEPVGDMSQMVEVADKMAQVAANRLPQAVSKVQMDAQERNVYLGLAQRLHDEAVVLKQQAQRNDFSAAQGTMNRVINTCNSCHTMFRDVAGPL
jgi:hypothetical protein